MESFLEQNTILFFQIFAIGIVIVVPLIFYRQRKIMEDFANERNLNLSNDWDVQNEVENLFKSFPSQQLELRQIGAIDDSKLGLRNGLNRVIVFTSNYIPHKKTLARYQRTNFLFELNDNDSYSIIIFRKGNYILNGSFEKSIIKKIDKSAAYKIFEHSDFKNYYIITPLHQEFQIERLLKNLAQIQNVDLMTKGWLEFHNGYFYYCRSLNEKIGLQFHWLRKDILQYLNEFYDDGLRLVNIIENI